jgi:glycine/D-amino acid oxidase-like deaminating enzyme
MHAILCGLRRFSHRAAQCAFLEAWAGFRPRTPDDRPILGTTGIGGLYVATGHFRHGILLAPVTAQVMADLILEGRSRVDIRPFSSSRFSG